MKAKRAEYDKKYMAKPEVKAKRARLSKQEQDQDAAEEAPTSNLRGKTYWDQVLADLWSHGGATSILIEAFPFQLLRGYSQWSPSSSPTTASEVAA